MLKTISVAVALLALSSLTQAKALDSFGHLPLAFELNHGQTHTPADFIARGPGYHLYLTSGNAILSLRDSTHTDSIVRMSLKGANPHPQAVGADMLPGVTNYFVGNDTSAWRSGIQQYARVKYEAVYPGVDLVYYGHQQQLEYDFIVAPGADPSTIALTFEGAKTLAVDKEGNLILDSGIARLVQHKPVIYQEVNGRRRVVSGGYAVNGPNARFNIGAYDHTRPLVIDPVLSYSTYLGSKNFDDGYGIAVDAIGDAYVVGSIYSDVCSMPPCGSGDVFVAKLSRDGTQSMYTTILGGSGQDFGHAIAVDSQGRAYVTGYTRSADFPTKSAIQNQYAIGTTQNAFVTRLDVHGALSYSTYLGGESSDTGEGIAVDANGNAYVTGYTSSSRFPTTQGALQTNLNGLQNAFVAKIAPSGSTLVYSTLLGGNDYDFGSGIAIDTAGNAYVTGTTSFIQSSTFPVTAHAYQAKQGGGSSDAFVSKLSADGSTLLYSTFLGGNGYDAGRSIAVDTGGNAYVAGFTQSKAFPTTAGVVQPTLKGTTDAFVAKLSSDGSTLVYSTYLGGSGSDSAYSIAVGANGNAYVTGFTQSTDFPTSSDAIKTGSGITRAAFVAVLNSNGGQLNYSTYLGGSNSDGGRGLAVDLDNNVYVTGFTSSSDFPTMAGAYRTTLDPSASQDAFVTKIQFGSAAGKANAVVSLTSSANPSVYGQSVTLTANVSALSTGTVTFLDGANAIGTGTLDDSGKVTLTTSTLAAGNHTITASYGGDINFNAATGALNGTPQVVNQIGQTLTFPLQTPANEAFAPNGTFAINPPASSGAPNSGNAITYSSLTPSVCAVSSTTVTMVAAGTCTIAANQAGNANYAAAAQVTQTIAIGKANQAITFTSTAPASPTVGGTYAIIATGGASANPVTFSVDGGATAGACSLAGSSVSFTGVGTCIIDANQAGNANYAAAAQVQQVVTINKASGALTMKSSANPSLFSHDITFTATVTPASGSTPPTGTIAFTDGAATLCANANLSGGSASCSTRALAVGTHTIQASYSGDAINLASSATLMQIVDKDATTITLTASPNPAGAGQTVTLMATVYGDPPAGTVVFYDGTVQIGTGVLAAASATSSVATFSINTLTPGMHNLSANYIGDGNNQASASAAVAVAVSVPPVAAPMLSAWMLCLLGCGLALGVAMNASAREARRT
ncbi:MAG: SBBP repeat-containing protein [Rudaea sp.]|uniref:beta strand repeat-containing protein n=1 Tax=unclassified Rudaea TaxID=2627037 RepID=UPI0010F4F59E|nr:MULTISPECIES: SBBP repeat-containing protein [unclassified Rudaea]MBN8886222.1 SBBP repeat-containing protein [Rudaea sp.]